VSEISTIGLDTAKQVFQVEGRDAAGNVVLRRQLRRGGVLKFFRGLPRCVVAMEACAAAHYWGREIAALGHDVRLLPPTRVKPYVKRGRKNDQADAAGCCEAVSRPGMMCVPLKTVEQQAALMLHRARKLLIEQRTRLANAIRGHLAEFGIIARTGDAGFKALLALLENAQDPHAPALIRPILLPLVAQWRAAADQIDALDRQILAWHKHNPDSLRLATAPQLGPIIASAFVATVSDPSRFKNGRQCAAWIGLVPSQHSTGGKTVLGPITKAGDRYLRQLLAIAGAGLIRRVKANPALFPWIARLLQRMPAKKAAIAVANKLARMAWAMLVRGETYKTPAAPLPEGRAA
jgi:transposase